jgi:hypothetical protein
MKVSLSVKLLAAFLPIIASPLALACGGPAAATYTFGFLFGAFFGVTLALPFRASATDRP